MTYKNNIIFLLSLIAAMALIYTGSIILDSEHLGARNSSYVWMDSKDSSRFSEITITGGEETRELIKRSGQWYVSSEGKEFPAKQLRVEDFINTFTVRSQYPVMTTSASSHERLGVTEERSYRVTFYAENSPLLDLLFGGMDITVREIFIRKYGQNEVRAGDSNIYSYLMGPLSNWYNLRLIPESEDGKIDVSSVQRLSVYTRDSSQVFSRKNKLWVISGIEVANPDQSGIDSYIRTVLNTEGSGFDESISFDEPSLDHNRLVLEFGNGTVRTIRLDDGDESGQRLAHVTGSNFIYKIPSWAALRLFRNAPDFER